MKLLTLENFKELEPYIAASDYNEYNSNIITMLMWTNRYPVYYEIFEHYALVLNQLSTHKRVWMMPYCEVAYREEAIAKMKTLSIQENVAFGIHSMTKEFKDWLQETYRNAFLVWDCFDARDYVYDRQQQESLSGKKMQKRRNHYHAFMKEYGDRYLYKPLEKEDIPAVYDFLKRWQQEKEEAESIIAESIGIHFLLDHYDVLAIQGGCIYIDGVLEAFSITSMLSKSTVQIHVEKANKNIRGLYIAILKCYLASLDEQVRYVNREDDMGLAELRKAKMDMHPIKKIKKFGSCAMDLTLRKAVETDIPAMKKLWLESFEEENEDSTAYYFQNFIQLEQTYLLTCEEGILSMAQLRPMEIMLNHEQTTVPLLFGVATNKEYQGCDYMKEIITHIQQTMKESLLFVQAYNWDIYRPFGFQEMYYLAKTKVKKENYAKPFGTLEQTSSPQPLLSLYQQFVKDKNGYRLRDEQYYQEHIAYASEWNQQYHLYVEDKAKGYVLIAENDEEIIIKECIYQDTETLEAMLSCIVHTDKTVYVYTDLETMIDGRRKEELHMMVYSKTALDSDLQHIFLQEEL